jgi:lysophosphatidylcholine acyltransferase/lyso-PAF acetyltransferase
VCYYVICRVCTLFSTPNREDEQEDYAHMGGWRRNVIVWCGKALSRVMLFVFGFYWITDSSSSSITQVQFLLQLFINCSISIHQEQLS